MMFLLLVPLDADAAEPFRATVPATGHQQLVAPVDTFGRHAVLARSPSGTAVQVVDRMTGPGPRDGIAGEADGRVDVFLERGDVQIRIDSDPLGTGDATIEVVPFTAPAGPRRLERGRVTDTVLGDFEQVDGWIEIEERQTVAVEALGRHLGDLRFWQDGAWLVDAAPRCVDTEVEEGRPLRRCTLVAELEPGWYLTSVYGGPGQPWSEAGDAQPLWLWWDVPDLPAVGRRTITLGDSGIARFAAPKSVDTVHLELEEVVPGVKLGLDAVGGGDPFAVRADATMTDETRRPLLTATTGGVGRRAMAVWGPPGTEVTLTWFDRIGSTRRIEASGDQWLATLHAGDPGDSIPPTGLLVRRADIGGRLRTLLAGSARGLPLSPKHRFEDTFNLLEPSRILLDVQKAGPYRFEAQGVAMQVVPLFLDGAPDGYESPSFESDELQVDLDARLHVLTLRPTDPGVASLDVSHDSWTSWVKDKLGGKPELVEMPPALMWESVPFDPGAPLELMTFSQPGVPVGLARRDRPVDARDGLPLVLDPGGTAVVPVRVVEEGILRASTADGTPLMIAAGDEPPSPRVAVSPDETGETLVQTVVTNPTGDPVRATLWLEPEDRRPDRPLPRVDPDELPLPDLPILSADTPAFLDLERSEEAVYRMEVDDPGLVEVQSTGLLATSGRIRTRIRTSLATASQNGPGRNFLVADYLRAGSYLVAVEAQGQSTGHLGLALRPTTVHGGGALTPGVPGRFTVPAGDAIRYFFEIEHAGRYRIRSRSREQTFQCRIEDGGGWPVETPRSPCDTVLRLEPGTYAVLSLPEQITTRRVTEVIREDPPAPPAREGHGPFALAPGELGRHTWTEPADGGERVPDTWTVDVPAEVDAEVRLSEEMVADLLRDGERIGRVLPGRPWSGELSPGPLTLEVRGARKSNGLPYTVQVRTTQLLPGQTRTVAAPSALKVAIGQTGWYAVATTGTTDVRARLYDETGDLVAANDDRPDDWNARLSARLDPGTYRLVLDDVSGGRGRTTVALLAQEERAVDAMKPGRDERVVQPGDDAIVIPLDLGRRDTVVASARADEGIGAAVEVQTDNGWRALVTETGRALELAARLPEADAPVDARLRVWSEDRRGNPVTVSVWAARPRRVGEALLGAGADLFGRPYAVVGLGGRQPGLFAVGDNRPEVWVCPEAGAACQRPSARPVGVTGDGLVLIGTGGRVRAERLKVTTEPSLVRLTDRALTVDVAASDSRPSVLVVRTPTGQPGASFGDGASPVGMAVSERAALAVQLGGAERARVWDAGAADLPLDARVTHQPMDDVQRAGITAGRSEHTVPPRTAIAWTLPEGRSDVDLVLGAGLVAHAADDRVVWADGTARAAAMGGVSGTLWVLNPTDREALVAVDVLPDRAAPPALTASRPLEQVHDRAGWQARAVSGEADATLYVRGTVDQAVYLRGDGRVLRGGAMEIGPGGTLWLRWHPGPLLAWVSTADHPGPHREVVDAERTVLGAGGRVPLSGEAHEVRVELDAPGLVQLTAPCPFIATTAVDGAPERLEVREAGGGLDLWLPEGTATLRLRALADTALWGAATVTSTAPTDIGEGLGPEVLLAPGGSRVFRFELPEDRAVGIGVDAEADRVLATVLDATGQPVGRGLVQLLDLKAGTWFLALRQPADAAPVRVRPALAGVEPPDTGPPDEVVQTYLPGVTP